MFKVILSYVMSLKPSRATSRDPASKRERRKKKKISYENNAHDTTSIYSMPNSILKCMLAQKMVEMERP